MKFPALQGRELNKVRVPRGAYLLPLFFAQMPVHAVGFLHSPVELDGKSGFVRLDDEVRLNGYEEIVGVARPGVPLVTGSSIGTSFGSVAVRGDRAAESLFELHQHVGVGLPNADLELVARVVACLDDAAINADAAFAIEETRSVLNVHDRSSYRWDDGEFGESAMPGPKGRGSVTPSQAGAVSAPGVCNEHGPSPKGKMCSDLHGNMQSKAEMTLLCGMAYSEHTTNNKRDTRYSGYDPLNVSASDVISAAEFPWRQVSVNIAASGLEIRSNQGENRIVNLVKTKIKNGQKSMANGLAQDFYSAGSLSNQVNGLQALVADAGTGTVGGINSTTFSFWQNVVQSAAAPLQGGGAITPSSTTIESLMLPLYLRLSRGADVPDLIVASEDYFTFYEQSQTSLKRYAPDDSGQGGMVAMKYKTADVFHDSSASGISSAHMYFLNTDYLSVVVHQDADMEIMPELRSINQDAVVIPVIWQGNLTVSNRKLQGVVKA